MSYHINIKLHISCQSSFNFHFNLNNSSKLYPGGGTSCAFGSSNIAQDDKYFR